MLDVLLLAGSPQEGSRSGFVLDYSRGILEQSGLQVARLTVRDLPAEDLVFGRYDSSAIKEAAALVAEARSLIVATPVYKAAYSGVLKSFLDLLPNGALTGKPVLPIATGGSISHLLAIDYALKPVLSALGVRYVLGGVYVVDEQLPRVDGNSFVLTEQVADRLTGALNELIALLAPVYR